MKNRRQFVHLGMVSFALLLRYLNTHQALLCAGSAFLFNFFLLPRIAPGIYLREEKRYSSGIILYPLSVFILLLFFPVYIVAGAWAIFAFGDSFATLIGRTYGRRKIFYNNKKTYLGSFTFLITAIPGSIFFIWWVDPSLSLNFIIFLSIFGSLFCAVIESLPLKIDDNLSVPLLGGLFIYLLTLINYPLIIDYHNLISGLTVSSIISLLAYLSKMVSLSGMLSGALIGISIYTFLGYQGFLILFFLFLSGSLATRFRYREKKGKGIAQGRGGRRSAKEVLANCSLGALLAFLARTTDYSELFTLAFLGSFAAATADTLSSELGQIYGKNPRLITNFKPVPRGTDGAVSLPGTILGVLGGLSIGLIAYSLKLINLEKIWIVGLAGFIGTTVDSILGATLEQKKLINNEGVNFLSTFSGALSSILFLRGG
jgi:uncharacterized protein (TIGR00297 family)